MSSRLLLITFFCIVIVACQANRQLSSSTSEYGIDQVVAPSTQAYSGVAFSQQPQLSVKKFGNLSSSTSYVFTVSAFTDSLCTSGAAGALSVNSSSLVSSNGYLTLSGLKYTNATALEERIYVKISSASAGISKCVGPIDVLHKFNSPNGYNWYDNGDVGMSGAVGAAKYDYATNRIIDSQNRMVLTGYSVNALGGYELFLMRYNPNGQLDATFGSSGVSLFQHNGNSATGMASNSRFDYPYGLVVDSQGRYVVAGYSSTPAGNWPLVIWRYKSDGSIDTTFGNGATAGLGYVIFLNGTTGAAGAPSGNVADFPFEMVIDSNGKYVLAGYSFNAAGGCEMAIWRYNTDGSLDTTFNSVGYVTFQNNGLGAAGAANGVKIDQAYSHTIDSSGNIIVAGVSQNSLGGYELVIWRYLATGAIDTTFGTGATSGLGYILFNTGSTGIAGATNATKYDGTARIKIDSSGKYVLAGYSKDTLNKYEPFIARYLTTGALDTTFGNGSTAGLGYVLFQNGGASIAGAAAGSRMDFINYMDIDSSGKIVVSGNSSNSAGGHELFIMRYNSDGSIDTTFGNGATAGLGYVLYNAGGIGVTGASNASKWDWGGVLIDSFGRYCIAGGGYTATGGWATGVWRYLSTGALDQ